MNARFEVNDLVHSKNETEKPGIVIKRYALEGEYRYVVRFADGDESVFFGFELDPEDNS